MFAGMAPRRSLAPEVGGTRPRIVLRRPEALATLVDQLAPVRSQDQAAQARRDGGRPGRACGMVQRLVTSWRCRRKIVAGVTSRPRRRRVGSSRARAAMTARSIHRSCGRGVRRCSTRSWLSPGRGSRPSLLVSERAHRAIQLNSWVNIR